TLPGTIDVEREPTVSLERSGTAQGLQIVPPAGGVRRPATKEQHQHTERGKPGGATHRHPPSKRQSLPNVWSPVIERREDVPIGAAPHQLRIGSIHVVGPRDVFGRAEELNL